VRRPAATALIALAVLTTAACGSSSKKAAPAQPTVPATTAETTTHAQPTTVHTTTAATTVAAPPPATTAKPAATTTTRATTTTTPRTVTAPPSVVAQTVCPSEQQPGIEANFGHRRSTAAAQALAVRAEKVGFSGLAVQRRGCNDYAVVLVGLKNLREALAFRREAVGAGFPVRIECRSHPVQGGLAAVFGHRRTRRQAARLARAVRRVGFEGVQVQQDRCNDWEVDLYGITTSVQRRDLSREAASVGYHLTFEPG
jgi:hypothetical protein